VRERMGMPDATMVVVVVVVGGGGSACTCAAGVPRAQGSTSRPSMHPAGFGVSGAVDPRV
jgi:hypothetical protein